MSDQYLDLTQQIMRKIRQYIYVLSKHPHPFRFLTAKAIVTMRLSHFFTIQQPGYILRFFPSALGISLWIDPGERRAYGEFVAAYLREGDMVIDVGANIGTTALAAAQVVGPQGKVVAVEPHPMIFSFLVQNIALNRVEHIQALNIALGGRKEILSFSDSNSDDQNAIAAEVGRTIPVPVDRLDDVFYGEGQIALLKIDVEGYERFVLAGAPAVITRVQCMLIEFDDEHFHKFGYSSAELASELIIQGFSLFERSGSDLWPIVPEFMPKRRRDLLVVRDCAKFIERTGYRIRIGAC